MQKFHPLTAIQNRDIVDPSGDYIGHVHDLLFNVKDGRIEYVCIALPPEPGRNGAEVVVPWSALRIRAGGWSWEVRARKRILTSIAQPVSRRSSGGDDPSND